MSDPQIKVLADKGYRMIFSNVDALYMDCGYGAWIGEKNNWCSPYKGTYVGSSTCNTLLKHEVLIVFRLAEGL